MNEKWMKTVRMFKSVLKMGNTGIDRRKPLSIITANIDLEKETADIHCLFKSGVTIDKEVRVAINGDCQCLHVRTQWIDHNGLVDPELPWNVSYFPCDKHKD